MSKNYKVLEVLWLVIKMALYFQHILSGQAIWNWCECNLLSSIGCSWKIMPLWKKRHVNHRFTSIEHRRKIHQLQQHICCHFEKLIIAIRLREDWVMLPLFLLCKMYWSNTFIYSHKMAINLDCQKSNNRTANHYYIGHLCNWTNTSQSSAKTSISYQTLEHHTKYNLAKNKWFPNWNTTNNKWFNLIWWNINRLSGFEN